MCFVGTTYSTRLRFKKKLWTLPPILKNQSKGCELGYRRNFFELVYQQRWRRRFEQLLKNWRGLDALLKKSRCRILNMLWPHTTFSYRAKFPLIYPDSTGFGMAIQ